MPIREAIILAGGKGTRLRRVVCDVPKPMASIQGKPFLEILIERFASKGISHFILSVGYMHEVIVEHFTNRYQHLSITFSIENEPLGTGGAIRAACQHLTGSHTLVMNGDSLFDVDLSVIDQQLVDQPILFGRMVDEVGRYGRIVFDDDCNMTDFSEKSQKGRGCINGGVYYLRKDSLDAYESHHSFSLEQDYFSQVAKHKQVTVNVQDSFFIDIGLPESFASAQDELLPYMNKKALFLDRDGVINIDSGYVHTKEQCAFVDGIQELLIDAKQKGYFIVVVTNQAGIGRGYYTEDQFHDFMGWINKSLGGLIDDYYFCPYHPEHGIGQYRVDSNERKPKPGMLLKAIIDHNIDPSLSVMVGDQVSDMEAASRAGLRHCYLIESNNPSEKNSTYESVACLNSVVERL